MRSDLMELYEQAKPANNQQVDDCLKDATRAQWVAPYILQTVVYARIMANLPERPDCFWHGVWDTCGANPSHHTFNVLLLLLSMLPGGIK